MTTSSPGNHPPKPPLVLHVGVTGHRPDLEKRLPPDVAAIQEQARQVLSLIRDVVEGIGSTNAELFHGGGPNGRPTATLRLLSSLAEGADQWVATEALRFGYELQCVLPFSREEYAADFSGRALGQYNLFLENAKTVLELDGNRAEGRSAASYEAAGRGILQQADLLVAIWDGAEEMGRGGAGQIVREALQSGVPVIWIKWGGLPGGWQLVDQVSWRLLEQAEDPGGDASRLKQTILNILLPPHLRSGSESREKDTLTLEFYGEKQRRCSCLRGFWAFATNCIWLKKPSWPCCIPPFEQVTQADWEQEWAGDPGARLLEQINQVYQPHYAWANQLSNYYGGVYRSSFLLIYLFGAAAVGCALAGIPSLIHHSEEWFSVVGELTLIVSILVLLWRGHMGGWHQRWIEYRCLAERLRLSRFMALLGGWRQQSAMPGHLAGYGDPINTWAFWHYRAVERLSGLPDARLDALRLKTTQFAFQGILTRSQVHYHQDNCARAKAIDGRLHFFGNLLFFATFAACGLHVGLVWFLEKVPLAVSGILVGLNALLPACGAAAAAIRSQSEFHRVARRSAAMSKELERLEHLLSFVSTAPGDLHSQELRQVIERIARLMLNETLDWRIVFQDRPLVLPA